MPAFGCARPDAPSRGGVGGWVGGGDVPGALTDETAGGAGDPPRPA